MLHPSPKCLTLLAALLISFAAPFADAADFYVAQSALGTGDGSSAANAKSISFFNSAANWSSPVKITGKIGPGDTVYLVGSISTQLIVGASGISGSVITIAFASNGTMTSTAWPYNGAISMINKCFITIDGRGNGVIQNTANGTAFANQVASVGVWIADSHDVVVQNLTVSNLYMRTAGPDQHSGSIGVQAKWNGGVAPYNIKVTNCTLHDMERGFYAAYGPGGSNFEYSFCAAYNCNWGGAMGDSNSSSEFTGLLVHDNQFYNFSNWDDTSSSNSFHHNGFYGWAEAGGSLRNVSFYNNDVGPNYGIHATSGLYFSGDIGNIIIYNNLFMEGIVGDHPGDGLIYLYPHKGTTGSGYQVYNNTFVGGGSGTALNLCGGLGQDQTIYEVENNLTSDVATFIAVYDNASCSLVSDYNLGGALNPSMQYSTSATSSSKFLTLAQWQALGYDVDSPIIPPDLNAAFAPQNPSGAIGTGVNLSAYFSTDKNLENRPPPGQPWDIGAIQSALTSGTVGTLGGDARIAM